MLKVEPFKKFERLYVARLEEFGVEAIASVLQALVDGHRSFGSGPKPLGAEGEGAVLLCFEKVHEGEDCHRRTFAAWWEKKTGNVVPELELER
jgi:hypothetical protein